MGSSNTLWWGVIGTISLILLLIMIIVVIIRFARKEILKQELQEAQLKSRLIETRLAALNSQMNPHFIFNCLNSIKLYTERNNNASATNYLDKFARLIRNFLENARRERITLKQELETLDLYLQLESMRVKDKVSYSIITNKDLDSEFIEIPPMLIQPFVENAIWHGLMNRAEGGNISIELNHKIEEGNLYVIIEDNGIGRAKALEIKKVKGEESKSFGMQITSERLQLLNQGSYAGSEITIFDLFDSLNNPSGTRAIIKLPVI